MPTTYALAITTRTTRCGNRYNQRPAWRVNIYRALDEVVAAAYGWSVDLSAEATLTRVCNH